jgi:hypothetical protein
LPWSDPDPLCLTHHYQADIDSFQGQVFTRKVSKLHQKLAKLARFKDNTKIATRNDPAFKVSDVQFRNSLLKNPASGQCAFKAFCHKSSLVFLP